MLIFMTPPRLCDKANGFHLCKILDYAGLFIKWLWSLLTKCRSEFGRISFPDFAAMNDLFDGGGARFLPQFYSWA